MEHPQCVLECTRTGTFHLRIQETHRTHRLVPIASLVLELSAIFYKSQEALKVNISTQESRETEITAPVPGEWHVLCMAGLPDNHRRASQGMHFTDPCFPSSVEWVGFLEAPLLVTTCHYLSWFPGWGPVGWLTILMQGSGLVFFPAMPLSVNHL